MGIIGRVFSACLLLQFSKNHKVSEIQKMGSSNAALSAEVHKAE